MLPLDHTHLMAAKHSGLLRLLLVWRWISPCLIVTKWPSKKEVLTVVRDWHISRCSPLVLTPIYLVEISGHDVTFQPVICKSKIDTAPNEKTGPVMQVSISCTFFPEVCSSGCLLLKIVWQLGNHTSALSCLKKDEKIDSVESVV